MAPDPVTPPWCAAPVGIVGLGLIGGSIALDLRRRGITVHGLVHRDSTAVRAQERGLVDRVSTTPEVLQGCALVVLALPLERLLEPDAALVAALPPEAVVTDVGSVKQPLLARWQPLHPRFVASHPMAGTAEAGVEAGLAGLFAGRPWVATPTPQTDAQALAAVQQLAELLGSHWFCCGAAQHDQAVALISHLPVLVSAALLHNADRAAPAEPLHGLVRALASSGFADTTRVGAGNPQLGTQMARTNRTQVLAALAGYRTALDQLEQRLEYGDWLQLEADLELAHRLRPQFL